MWKRTKPHNDRWRQARSICPHDVRTASRVTKHWGAPSCLHQVGSWLGKSDDNKNQTFTKSLLVPTDHSKPCAGTIWPNSHNNSKNNSAFLSPSYKWGKWGSKALRDLPRVIQPVNSGAGLYPGAWLPSPCSFPLLVFMSGDDYSGTAEELTQCVLSTMFPKQGPDMWWVRRNPANWNPKGPTWLTLLCMHDTLLQLCLTLCDPIARQAPLSMGFSRQEYWSELPCPSTGNLPDPGIKPVSLMSPALAGRFFTTGPPGKSQHYPSWHSNPGPLPWNPAGLENFAYKGMDGKCCLTYQ